jgi:hypothetical protein
MSDNFDLKKFLKESKAIENLNPVFHRLNENKKTKITKTTLVENNLRAKVREMVLAELGGRENYNLGDDIYDYNREEDPFDGMDINFGDEYNDDEDYDLESRKLKYGINPEMDDEYNEEDEDDIYEAKKDKAEDMPADDEEIDLELEPEMDAPETELSAAAAGATGDAKELINNLMTSLDVAKAMGNEKLTTQILNTLKFAIDQSMAQ